MADREPSKKSWLAIVGGGLLSIIGVACALSAEVRGWIGLGEPRPNARSDLPASSPSDSASSPSGQALQTIGGEISILRSEVTLSRDGKYLVADVALSLRNSGEAPVSVAWGAGLTEASLKVDSGERLLAKRFTGIRDCGNAIYWGSCIAEEQTVIPGNGEAQAQITLSVRTEAPESAAAGIQTGAFLGKLITARRGSTQVQTQQLAATDIKLENRAR